MPAHQGKIHNYLGMTLEYTEGVTFKFIMIDYINELIAAFDKKEPRGRGINTSPASEDLYKVDEDFEKLSPEKTKIFHYLVAKTLYNTKCASPYTCTVV